MANAHGQTIALTMIVKDEEKIILRALSSLRNIVDYYCICDTGSTDNTIEVVENYLKDNNLDGKVVSHEWKNFGHNRTLALKECEGICDYQMTLDADEVIYELLDGKDRTLNFPKEIKEKLSGDIIHVPCFLGGLVYKRTLLWKSGIGIFWSGVCHEFVSCARPTVSQSINSICNVPWQDSTRNLSPTKYLDDAKLFEDYLIDNPTCSRSWFYLGQSYADSQTKLDRAIYAMKKCVEYTTWDEEKYMSLYRIGKYYQAMSGGKLTSDSIYYYLEAYDQRPDRIEPLLRVIENYRREGKYVLAEPLCDAILKKEYPQNDLLFVEAADYKWKAKDEASIVFYWIGRYRESYNLCLELLDSPDLPEDQRPRVRVNANFSKEKLSIS